MTIFPSLSAWRRRRSRRERIVVAAGGLIVAAVLAYHVVGTPYARAWIQREDQIALRADQLGRLRALLEQEQPIRAAVAARRERQAAAHAGFLEGDTPAIAASALLVLLNRAANESQVVLERVDVADDAVARDDPLVPIPARLSALGDVSGLVDFLFQLRHGDKLVVIDEFQLVTGQAVRTADELARWTLSLHGYYVPRRAES